MKKGIKLDMFHADIYLSSFSTCTFNLGGLLINKCNIIHFLLFFLQADISETIHSSPQFF